MAASWSNICAGHWPRLFVLVQIPISKEESVAGRVVEHVRLLEQELDVLKHLDHPNIVRYLVSHLHY